MRNLLSDVKRFIPTNVKVKRDEKQVQLAQIKAKRNKMIR